MKNNISIIILGALMALNVLAQNNIDMDTPFTFGPYTATVTDWKGNPGVYGEIQIASVYQKIFNSEKFGNYHQNSYDQINKLVRYRNLETNKTKYFDREEVRNVILAHLLAVAADYQQMTLHNANPAMDLSEEKKTIKATMRDRAALIVDVYLAIKKAK